MQHRTWNHVYGSNDKAAGRTSIARIHDVKLWPGKCEWCVLGKPRRSTHKMKARREPKGFDTDIHTNNTATQPVKTFHGETVGNIAVDRWSN